MHSDYSSSSTESEDNGVESTTKRKKGCRMSSVMKILRAQTHEMGPDCSCKRLRCFENVSEEERKRILRDFNALGDNDKQNVYLSGLISVLPVMRRRPRKTEADATTNNNSASFAYRVRVMKDGTAQDVQICLKAFMSMHGISERKVKYVRNCILTAGIPPTDMRGKHLNRRHKMSEETKTKVVDFIQSLKGRKSHYSLKESQKIYLPDELNITKLHNMYSSQNPHNNISYESFRVIFQSQFNISFGYPRKDTCSTCDSYKADVSSLNEQIKSCSDNASLENLRKQLDLKQRDNKLHLKKSDRFYSLKKSYRKRSMKSTTLEAVAMDFQKNLPCPNITTNDIYYRRQLNFIIFNIHILSNSRTIFYTYDETVAKKGSDDVCSMFYHFVFHILPPEVRELAIFCDSCAGQNKNFSFFRLLHYLVTKDERFDTVKVIFPIRGHSYLECDRNMSLVNQKHYTETPDDWREVLRNTRVKPSPFEVIDCTNNFSFQNWTRYLSSIYYAKCPFPTRPIRMLKISKEDSCFIFHKPTFFGSYASSPVLKPPRNKTNRNPPKSVKLRNLYNARLPVKAAKYRDLLHLSKFLEKPQARDFYKNLTPVEVPMESDDDYIDDPPIDSEIPGEE